MITITIQRATLVKLQACTEGLALYDAIAAQQPASDARRSKRLRFRYTPLHCVWLASAYPGFASWLIARALVPLLSLESANLRGANLGGANLYGANLYGANLGGANLYGALLAGANLGGALLAGANLGGANLYGALLAGANLGGANLYGANLRGAYRSLYDAPIAGWRRNASGYLERDTPQVAAPARTNGAATEVQP